jgi:hypothetical protein
MQIYINGREWLAHQLDKAGHRLPPLRERPAAGRASRGRVGAVRAIRAPGLATGAELLGPRLNPMLPAIRAANYGGCYWVLDGGSSRLRSG